MRGADLLDQRDPLGKSFAGSLLFHGGLLGVILFGSALLPKPVRLGSPNQHGGTIGVDIVSSIPLPRREGPKNPVANDTKSIVPQEPTPKPKPKPVVKEKTPPPEAIKIPERDKKPKKRVVERAESANPYRPERPPDPSQLYSRTEQSMVSPMYGIKGTNGIGVGPSNPFGEQFGWYAQQIFDRVGQKWNRAGVTSRPHATAVVRFLLMKDGTVQNVQVVQRSGSYTLDTSAERAVLDAVPLPAFPRGFPYSSVNVDLNFELQQ